MHTRHDGGGIQLRKRGAYVLVDATAEPDSAGSAGSPIPVKISRHNEENREPTNTNADYSHLVQEFCGVQDNQTDEANGHQTTGGTTYVLYDSGFVAMDSSHPDEHISTAHQLDYTIIEHEDQQSANQTHHQADDQQQADQELTDLLDLDRRQLFFESANSSGCQNNQQRQMPVSSTTDGDYFRCSLRSETSTTLNIDVNCAGGQYQSKQPQNPVGSHHQQHQQQQHLDDDLEDRNLSWLFNFRLDELPHLSPELNAGNLGRNASVQQPANVPTSTTTTTTSAPPRGKRRRVSSGSSAQNSSSSSRADIRHKVDEIIKEATALEAQNQQHQQQNGLVKSVQSQQLLQQTKYQAEQLQQMQSSVDRATAAAAAAAASPSTATTVRCVELQEMMPKKPPFTYTELIEYALEDKGELTVSGIYQWIFDRFPYYKSNDDRWKNSVRHNLSINPHFRKGSKAAQGAGHLWTISSRDSESNLLAWEHKKQRLELYFKMERIHQQQLEQHQSASAYHQQNSNSTSPHSTTNTTALEFPLPSSGSTSSPCNSSTSSTTTHLTETDIAVAHITNYQYDPASSPFGSPSTLTPPTSSPSSSSLMSDPQQHQQYHNHSTSSADFTFVDCDSDAADLRRSAGEILNGVRRRVQVQVIGTDATCESAHLFPPDALLMDAAFLNPVPKEQVVHESGLHQSHQQQHQNQTDDEQQHHRLADDGGYHTMLLDAAGNGNSGSESGVGQMTYVTSEIDPGSLQIVHQHQQLEHQQYDQHHIHQQSEQNQHHLIDSYTVHQSHHQQLHHHNHQHQLHQYSSSGHSGHSSSAAALVDEVEVLFAEEFNLNYFGFMQPSAGSSGVAGNLMA